MARHIPVDELPHRHAELGQGSHLVFICHSGGHSAAAGEFMTSIGGTHIYNVADVLADSGRIAICEGELDALVMSGICDIPAVGIPGVAAWKPYYTKLFGGFDTIYVIGDNDLKEDGTNPGAEFSRRVAGEVLNSQIVQLPQGMDINEYYLAFGKESVRELLGVAK